MNSLSPDQANALWSAGGFFVLADLPPGSEIGIDGTYHTVRRFGGVKFVPPGLHLFTWTPAPRDAGNTPDASASGSVSTPLAGGGAGPGALPIRTGLFYHFAPRERVVRKYDPALENVPFRPDEPPTIISEDGLRTLDASMAPYPFEGLELWRQCTGHITPAVLNAVVGREGRVDGMMEVEGEASTGDQDLRKAIKEMSELSDARQRAGRPGQEEEGEEKERSLRFVKFDIRRSWPPGSVGEEVTKWSMDKSWLLSHVSEALPGGMMELLGQLQLAFILLVHLSAAPCLSVYQRILRLFCQSRSILFPIRDPSISKVYIALVESLAAQLATLPADAFLSELPELDAFYLEQLDSLRKNLSAGFGMWKTVHQEAAQFAWSRLVEIGRTRWGWSIPPLSSTRGSEEDEEEYEEDGEDAPVIVDI